MSQPLFLPPGAVPFDGQPKPLMPREVPVVDTCCWWDGEKEDRCGAPAVDRVRVRTKPFDALIDVCRKHKRVHNHEAMKLRNPTRS